MIVRENLKQLERSAHFETHTDYLAKQKPVHGSSLNLFEYFDTLEVQADSGCTMFEYGYTREGEYHLNKFENCINILMNCTVESELFLNDFNRDTWGVSE